MSKVPTIKRLLEIGQYRIDPYAIADAMIRWAAGQGSSGTRSRAAADQGDQSECSNPESRSSASAKTTPGEPSPTDPIQFRAAFVGGEAA